MPNEALGKRPDFKYNVEVEKTVKHFRTFAAAEKCNRDFYETLTGNERPQILVEQLNHGPERRLERVGRVTKLPEGLIMSLLERTALRSAAGLSVLIKQRAVAFLQRA